MGDIAEALGRQIRSIRTSKGITMERLAELAALSPTYVSTIERGRKEASVQTLVKVADALNVRLSDLTATLENRPERLLTKYEVLGRLEREMREFFTEEEADDIVSRVKPHRTV